jgi:hypothetical protein
MAFILSKQLQIPAFLKLHKETNLFSQKRQSQKASGTVCAQLLSKLTQFSRFEKWAFECSPWCGLSQPLPLFLRQFGSNKEPQKAQPPDRAAIGAATYTSSISSPPR